MKFFIIRIEDENNPAHEHSMAAADRCAASLKKFNVDYGFFPAYTPDDEIVQNLMNNRRFMAGFRDAGKYARVDRCVAAHLSHRTLWEMCLDGRTEPIGILEHDAVMVREMPNYLIFPHIVNLGKPSYGRWRETKWSGVQRLFSKGYFPGAHAYAITPDGAKAILDKSKGCGGPTDTFLSLESFSFLQEHYPWVFEADDRFSSIQAERGCLAKHGLNDGYKRV